MRNLDFPYPEFPYPRVQFLFFQVPGRLGLLITLELIATNTYNSLKAPSGRGFSYVEIWQIGIQIPILLAIVEYGILMTLKRMHNRVGLRLKSS